MIKQWIVGEDEPNEKKQFIWNMIGSLIYAISSMLLTYGTIRIVGEKEGGYFAIALTLAQMFVYIAYYEMRNYEVTDILGKYTFKDYHGTKIINCVLMMLVMLVYCIVKHYDIYKAIVVLLVGIYRLLDGYADVFEAEFHKKNRLDLAGKSMAFRTMLSVMVYFIVLIITKKIIIALSAGIISGILGILIFDILIFDCVGEFKAQFKWNKLSGILRDCFPMFAGMFLWTYLLSASRIAVDDIMESQYQSYYQILFLPVSVINLLVGFLIRPRLIKLTELYASYKKKKFWSIIVRILSVVVLFTLVCMIGAYLFGIEVLQVVSGCDLTAYRGLFVFLICAGGFNAIACLLYHVLTIYRRGVCILGGYIISSVLAYFISPILVMKSGLWGAAASYFISILLLLVVFVGCIIYKQDKVRS